MNETQHLLPSDFAVRSVQASAFVSGSDLRPTSMLVQSLQEWGQTYDADPISMPLPPDAPGDLPAVILSSRDNTYRLEVARARVNLFWQRQGEESVEIGQTLATFANRLVTLFAQENLRIGRLAAVVTRIAECPRPGIALARQFCRDEWLSGPLNRPEGFELHAHKVCQLVPDLQVNSWMRIKTAYARGQGYQYVLVEQDLNSLAEELLRRAFSADEVASFFERASAEFGTILELYFPLA